MDLGAYTGWKESDVILLAAMAVLAALISLSVFAACFYWFLREQRRLQRRLLSSLADGECDSRHLFSKGRERPVCGELVAQFKVNQGKQVVSLMESDGKRFIHVDGELSGPERARMVRYLKSEGFMS